MKNIENDLFHWNYISGTKYYKILEILDDEKLSDIDKEVELISIITDLTPDEVLDLPIQKYSEYSSKLVFLNKFTLTPYKRGRKFKLPSYTIKPIDDISNITIGQYIDFQSYISQPFSTVYSKLLSIILIPEGFSYNEGYDIIDLQREIEDNISWPEVQGLFDFFIKVSDKSLVNSLIYCTKKMKKTKDPKMKELIVKQMNEIKKKRELILTGLKHLTYTHG